ncbi:MAG: sodium:solute symporter [Pirellulaceae bacterium]
MNLSIGGWDLLILVSYLLLVILFGLWVGRGKKDLTGYLLGGRDVPWWALLGSIIATETSTATFLSVPGIAYAHQTGDLRFLQLALGYIIGRILIVWILLPQYFQGNMFTAYEVLDRRFGGATKKAASLLFLVTRNLGDGLRLFLTALVLEKVIGLSITPCVVILGVATIVYTFFGGIRSVIWNDCVQLIVYLGGGLLAVGFLLNELPGGWEQYLAYGQEQDKFRVFDFSWDFSETFTIWAGVIGGMFLTLGTHGTDQMMVQRYLAARSQADAGRALICSGFAVLVQFALFLLIGVALACYYDEFPPLEAFGPQDNDKVFATFIVDKLPIGVVGITLAAVLSAALSTASSSLNSSASSAVSDLYRDLKKQTPSDRSLVRVSRRFTIFFGCCQIVIAVVAQYFSSSVVSHALAIAGFSAGILLGLFFLGVFTRHVLQRDAFCGLAVAVVVLSYVKFGTEIAWPWYALIGAATTIGIGLLANAVLPTDRVIKPAEEEGDCRHDSTGSSESSD